MNSIKKSLKNFLFPSKNPFVYQKICENSLFKGITPVKGFLIEKAAISENNFLMKIEFEDKEKYLGNNIGEFVSLKFSLLLNLRVTDKQGVDHIRFYSPISRINDKGQIHFAIKTLRNSNNELQPMSKALLELKDGDEVYIDGPYGTYSYKGYGDFIKIKLIFVHLRRNNNEKVIRNFENIGFIAEGTGITAFFQIIEAIATSSDQTKVSLLYYASKLEDLILLEELEWFKSLDKINLAVITSEGMGPGLEHLNTKITKRIVQDHMPPPIPESVIFICGSNIFRDEMTGFLKELNYSEKSIWPRFSPALCLTKKSKLKET